MHFVLIEFAPKFVSQWYLNQLRRDELHFASPDPAEYVHVLAAGL